MTLFPFSSHLCGRFLVGRGGARFNSARLFSREFDIPLDQAGSLACRLSSRSVIRFRGPDTVKFLQGLLSNDVRPLAAGSVGDGGERDLSSSSYVPTSNVLLHSPPPRYATLLTPQGRFLYDLFLYRAPRPDRKLNRTGSGPGPRELEEALSLMADVDANFLDEILDTFSKYKLRSKVDIENVTEDFSCWQRFGGNLSENIPVQEPEAASVGWGGGMDSTSMSSAHGNDLGWHWHRDPRLVCLGFRGIFPSNTVPPLVEADKEADERHYLLWRLERGIPEGSTEIAKGEAIPLEHNLEGLNAISFDKGCYVGQELIARTHHRGVIRKRLLPFKFTDNNGQEIEQPVSLRSEVVDSATNKKVGIVIAALGFHGMGLLKLEEALKQPSTLCLKESSDVKVKPFRPQWWPAEWSLLQYQQSAAEAS